MRAAATYAAAVPPPIATNCQRRSGADHPAASSTQARWVRLSKTHSILPVAPRCRACGWMPVTSVATFPRLSSKPMMLDTWAWRRPLAVAHFWATVRLNFAHAASLEAWAAGGDEKKRQGREDETHNYSPIQQLLSCQIVPHCFLNERNRRRTTIIRVR